MKDKGRGERGERRTHVCDKLRDGVEVGREGVSMGSRALPDGGAQPEKWGNSRSVA